MLRQQVEVLAPASGPETIRAAIQAGADAVYTGGAKFGARAYADNLIEEQLLEAIDFVHLHGKRLYLTVNTLLKEEELEEQLVPYLTPFYLQGLDAVIVQDFGVFRKIRQYFPELAIHVSTQAVVTGADSAKLYERLGAQRIVTARELSLDEIRKIRQETELEIESFVHGALCYCYSGQCLFSSFLGGRSGNRGRCAQPCRLAYELCEADGKGRGRKPVHLLSPKDMCALDILPDIIEAGVNSLKIEGRMKRTEYAAGVSELYRKYTDLYFTAGREGYAVEDADKRRLMDLYNRGSFHSGYYVMHNGKEMMSTDRPNHNGVYAGTLRYGKRGFQMKTQIELHRKDTLEFRDITDRKTGAPLELMCGMDVQENNLYFLSEKYTFLMGKCRETEVYRTKNECLLEELHTKYVEQTKQIPVCGSIDIAEGKPVVLRLEKDGLQVKITGEAAQTARNQPADEAGIRRQLSKTGGGIFCWKRLDIRLEGSVFLSVRELNELRRNGFDLLKRALTEQFRREQTAPGDPDVRKSPKERERTACRNYAMVESWEQLGAVMSCPAVDGIDVSIHALTLDGRTGEHMEEFEETAGKLHRQGRFIALVLPYILRMRDKKRLAGILCSLAPVLDSLVVKNIESLAFVKTIPQLDKIPIRTDYTAYAMNGASICQWGELGVSSVTLPVELNRYELGRLAGASVLATELVIYGHMPMMVSAQCVVRNTIGCQGQRYPVRIRDRKKQLHYVQNYCDNCYNVIYNDEPFSLLDCLDETEAFGLSVRKLHFTVETATQTRQVLDIFTDNYINGAGRQPETFTRGHWKRGVE